MAVLKQGWGWGCGGGYVYAVSGEKTGLYLDCGGGSTSLHMGSNCTELYIHAHESFVYW